MLPKFAERILSSTLVLCAAAPALAGQGYVEVSDSAFTLDGQPSAHYEHTVAITENGPEILTRIEGSH